MLAAIIHSQANSADTVLIPKATYITHPNLIQIHQQIVDTGPI